MLKRALKIGLALAIGLATQPMGTTQAGNNWTFIQPPGMWWNFGTVDGCASIARVPNPATKPALLRCDITLTQIETLCENPNGLIVKGEASTKVIASNAIDPSDLLQKDKGKANVCVQVDELALGGEELCVNGNWTAVGALTTEFSATCTTEACTGVDNPNTPQNEACNTTVVANTQVCACTLPPGFSVENPPDACADPLNPENCTAYICNELDPKTLQPTGNQCSL
jgi:hypothetical protein